MKTTDTLKVLGGVFLGAAIGTAIGILIAPNSGKKTRKDISKKSKEYAQQVTDSVKEYVDAIIDKYAGNAKQIADKANRAVENGKKVVNQ